MFDHYPLDFVYWYEVEKELLPWKMSVALPWIFWMFSTAYMRTLEKLIMITLTVCKTNDMSCFYLTACRYQSWVWNISVSCLSSQPCVLSGNFLTWCFLSLSTEWTESRLICLVRVPLELIIFYFFFLSKDWKDGVSVLPAPLDIPCWLRLSANTGCNCKPCVLQNNKRITTAVLKTALFQNKLLYDECWILGGSYNCIRLVSPTTSHGFSCLLFP